jgi:hypothetical protein
MFANGRRKKSLIVPRSRNSLLHKQEKEASVHTHSEGESFPADSLSALDVNVTFFCSNFL